MKSLSSAGSNRILKSPYVVLDKAAVSINNELQSVVLTQEDFVDSLGDFDIPDEEMGLTDAERAEKMLERARDEAARIIQEAKDDAGLILDRMELAAQDALKQLEDEARETGYADGYAKGEADTEAIKEQARTLYANAIRERHESLSSIEGDVVSLISDILTKLLTDAVNIDPQIILCLVRKGFTESKLSGDVTIRVSEDDYDEAYANRGVFAQYADAGAKIDILKDFSLKRSDCIIETPYGAIDCSLDQQFTALKKNLYYIFENR